ncbi:MAG: N-acetylmannosamine-6-phosphate 2-epimerase [Spirulina sp. SIO3F2]|nr:N-acetylmannosamine-6-phosphate 2-epimerase [Spirulina sp. SIO3F2]
MLTALDHQLIVSCQAPPDSPLYAPEMIAAIAKAAVLRGAAAVRIDTPAHVKAVRQALPQIPIIGLWKQTFPGSEVYITPRFADAMAIAEAGADIIAIDATLRDRPNGEQLPDLVQQIKNKLGKRVMADADDLAGAKVAVEAGAEIAGTTLYGYTTQTRQDQPPAWALLEKIATQLDCFTICEGGIATPEMAQQALDLGANAVVVGTAITGVDLKVQAFMKPFET